MKYLHLVIFGLIIVSCSPKAKVQQANIEIVEQTAIAEKDKVAAEAVVKLAVNTIDYDTTLWTDIKDLDASILLDLRYATSNNFVATKMYDCARCFLRPEAAQLLKQVQAELQLKGYGLKVFDCYRPRPIQWKLWEKVPDPKYVADPRKGSMHNRGVAVDVTIVDQKGNELDMGTDFDYFGKKAYHDFTDLSVTVLANRKLLKSTMEKYGFKAIRTEWWHYSYRATAFPLSNMLWACD